MTTRKYVHIPEISCSFLGLPTDGYILCKNQAIRELKLCEEDLKSRIFLCCVMMTKHICGFIYALQIIFIYDHSTFICRRAVASGPAGPVLAGPLFPKSVLALCN